ncbi:MAG TPA: hypothetical protein DCK98_03690 [Chloroflexi bacterium]|jgi:hypothetical protein|nr:hypothetical protein [Chloroflexota bacterium]HAL28396.1 hypothetical protein [Chloroflexota bacterium]
MTPDQITEAITKAFVEGGQQWLVLTIAAFMPALWAFTLMLHLARPYVIRTLRKLSLRFGADVWWLTYVLVRDAVTILTFGLSFIFLMPNLILTFDLPLTAPLATLFLFWALYVKLLYDADDNFGAYRLVTALLVIGATLYFVPQTLGLESNSQDYLAGLVSFFDSTKNQAWAGPILIVALIGSAVTAGAIFWRVVLAPAGSAAAATGGQPRPATR